MEREQRERKNGGEGREGKGRVGWRKERRDRIEKEGRLKLEVEFPLPTSNSRKEVGSWELDGSWKLEVRS